MTLASALALTAGSTVRFTTNGATGIRTGTVVAPITAATDQVLVRFTDNMGQQNTAYHFYSQLT